MKSGIDRFQRFLVVSLLSVTVSFSLLPAVHAAVKDSDADGLTDSGEIQTYKTDPNNPDTDGDGVPDGQEVVNGTNPLDGSDIAPQVADFTDPGILGPSDRFPWFFARAAGIVAFVLLTASTAFGLIMSSRAFLKIVPGADAYEFHRSLSLASVVAVVLHFGAFFFEGFLRMTFAEIFLPFAFVRDGLVSASGFGMTMPIALGIIALYLVITLVLTAEFRTKMPPKVWRIVHYVSFVAYPLFVAHGFMSGTDSPEGWMRAIYLFSVLLVVTLVITRIVVRTIVPAVRRLRVRFSDSGR